MKVIIVRHGHALGMTGFKSDSQRPLSESGIQEAQRVAWKIKEKIDNEKFEDIYHSKKRRAIETAEIICRELNSDSKSNLSIKEVQGLNPCDNPLVWCNAIHARNENLILVSHLPFVELLSQSLIPGELHEDLPVFSTATAVCLEKNSSSDYNHDSDKFVIKWAAGPDKDMEIS